MSQRNLLVQAEQCRTQAQAFEGAERQLLLRMAELFETISKSSGSSSPVDAIRCW